MTACIFVHHNFSCSMRIYETLFFFPLILREMLYGPKGNWTSNFLSLKQTFNEHM